jgi:circadian clock protein KaiC
MNSERVIAELSRLRTGVNALDSVLGGGFPTQSTTIISGEPGSGKTVLMLQILSHLARQGKKCLYFTTVSEPAIKLIRHMQLFSFFDPKLLDERILIGDLGSVIRTKGFEAALAHVTERCEDTDADVVVIDSFKAIHDLVPKSADSRRLIYDLAAQLASWGATTFLVGEYSLAEVTRLPEFSIVDGIVFLRNEANDLTRVREFEILKSRGSDYIGGRHFFEITGAGVLFYPRVTVPRPAAEPSPVDGRVPFSVTGLDEMLGGGLPAASATLIEGGTGTGKTLLGLHFLTAGAAQGEIGLYFTLEESPSQLRAVARNFGLPFAEYERRGLLSVRYASPLELSPDRFLHEARALIEQTGARRVVLDSLTGLSLGVPSERRFKQLVYALSRHFRELGVTLVMTMEVPEVLGGGQLTGHGVSSITDNVILLRYLEVQGHLERAISVLKARTIAHSTELRAFSIIDRGASVGGPLRQLRGVLTGLPVPVSSYSDMNRQES